MDHTLLQISDTLSDALDELTFSDPVAHVYNPARYARAPFARYCERFGSGPKEVLLLGMNPGPWGMAQTGVPFGEVAAARDWLGVGAPVTRPENEHPKRPIDGFACKRSEVSGRRLWGWAASRFGTADAFFKRFFVVNYCPLIFLEEGGRNKTPDKLTKAEREPMLAVCDIALRATVTHLNPTYLLGVGKWAEKALRRSFSDEDYRIGSILHPSPASPLANRGWAPQAEAQLRALGIALPDNS